MPEGLQNAVLYHLQRHLRTVRGRDLQCVSELRNRGRFRHTDLYGLQRKHVDAVLLSGVADKFSFARSEYHRVLIDHVSQRRRVRQCNYPDSLRSSRSA